MQPSRSPRVVGQGCCVSCGCRIPENSVHWTYISEDSEWWELEYTCPVCGHYGTVSVHAESEKEHRTWGNLPFRYWNKNF